MFGDKLYKCLCCGKYKICEWKKLVILSGDSETSKRYIGYFCKDCQKLPIKEAILKFKEKIKCPKF